MVDEIIDSTGELTVCYGINFNCSKHGLNPFKIVVNIKKAYCMQCIFELLEKNGIMPMELKEELLKSFDDEQ